MSRQPAPKQVALLKYNCMGKQEELYEEVKGRTIEPHWGQISTKTKRGKVVVIIHALNYCIYIVTALAFIGACDYNEKKFVAVYVHHMRQLNL